jgi:uncharacterized protein
VDIPTPPQRQILVFVRSPERGRVKTRLARTVGDDAALALYRDLGRTLVERLRAGGLGQGLRICHTPDDPVSRARVARWLGVGEGQLAPQGDGSLGARMYRALDRACSEGALACVVGSDIPALDADHLMAAFEALEAGSDLVLGPALDGGYYLIGMRTGHPELFRDVPWSTEHVLAVTLERAGALALRTHLLPALRDIDEATDLEGLSVPASGRGSEHEAKDLEGMLDIGVVDPKVKDRA